MIILTFIEGVENLPEQVGPLVICESDQAVNVVDVLADLSPVPGTWLFSENSPVVTATPDVVSGIAEFRPQQLLPPIATRKMVEGLRLEDGAGGNNRRTPHIKHYVQNGGAREMTGCNMRAWLAASMLLLSAQTPIPSHGNSVRPLLTWSTWVPDLAHQHTASTLTPSEDITVTRVEAQVEGIGVNCAANAIISVSNGAVSVPVSTTAMANDTGPVNTKFVAGIPITVNVSSQAACQYEPGAANVVVQFNSAGTATQNAVGN